MTMTMMMMILLMLLFVVSDVACIGTTSSTAIFTATEIRPRQIKIAHVLRRQLDDTDEEEEEDDTDDIEDGEANGVGDVVGSIRSLRLLNSNIDVPLRYLTDQNRYNIYNYPTLNLNIKVETEGIVGSVLLTYSSTTTSSSNSSAIPDVIHSHSTIDSVAPFSLCGDSYVTKIIPTRDGTRNRTTTVLDYDTCPFLSMIGTHTLTVTPYELIDGAGVVGIPYTITFYVTNVKTKHRHCKTPKFFDISWENFLPYNPVKVGEPQGLIIGGGGTNGANDLIVFSGFRNGYTIATNRTYVRDIRSMNTTWRRMDDMPLESGITHMATVTVGNMVYLCGGYHGPHPGPHTPICFQYDHSVLPGTGAQWSYLPSLPNGGTAGAGMIYSTEQNTLYYAGGGQRLTPGSVHPVDVDNTWKLVLHDLSAGWLPSTPIPYLANHISYVTNRDTFGTERHFMLGGQISENECCGNLAFNYEFIPTTETWIERAMMPIPRGHAASSTRAVGCGFIIAGGSINNPNGSTRKTRTDDVSYYDIHNDVWTSSIGRLPGSGATPIVDIHNNGYMHFVNALPMSDRRRISVQ